MFTQVRAGDLLRMADGSAARVRCVVVSECTDGIERMVTLPGGLQLTPRHPVREAASGKWRLPCTLGTPRVRACEHIFNLVLECNHVLHIGGEACVTLGHDHLVADLVGHDYWGGAAVLSDLSLQPGWAQGFVLLRPGQLAAAPGYKTLVAGRRDRGVEEEGR